MSGTIANKLKQEKALAEQRMKSRLKADRERRLVQNREEVIAEVCAMFGWKELDPFAKEMLDNAFAGNIVNVKQLKKDLAAWKEAQSVQTEEPAVEETEVVSDDQHI